MIDDLCSGFYRSQIKVLNLSSDNLFTILECNSDTSKKYILDKSIYKFARSYKYEGKTLAIKYFKQLPYWTLPDFYLSFHLSQFDSFSQFKLWLRELSGPFYSIILNDSIIYRLDCCFETSLFNLDYVYSCAYRRYVSLPQLKLYGEFYEV